MTRHALPRGRSPLPLRAALAAFWALLAGAAAAPGDQWWDAAWAYRKRVVVPLAAEKPLGFFYKPPSEIGEDLLAAQVVLSCEGTLKAGAEKEIRVVDAGGNLLPSVATGPDELGRVRVVFPARRTIAGQLASPLRPGAQTVELTVGHEEAVVEGMRFYVTDGPDRAAELEVVSAEEKTSTARVVSRPVPSRDKGAPVRSAVLTDAQYFVYYGNPEAKGAAPSYAPPGHAVTQYAWLITSGGVPTSEEELRNCMRASPKYLKKRHDEQVNNRSNVLDLSAEAWYVSAYESYIYCPMPGLYRFSVDSGGSSFLFVDGRKAAERPGFHHQVANQFEHRGKIPLDEGAHHVVFLAVESGKKYLTRLAWQPVTGKVFKLMPPEAFLSRIPARVVGYEARDQRHQAFFTYRLAPRAVAARGGERYQFVRFDNRTVLPPRDAGAEASYVWELGDGTTSREREACHFYKLPQGQRSTTFAASLEVVVGRRVIGRYRGDVHVPEQEADPFQIAADVVSFADIVYEDERTGISVRLRNRGFSPLILRAVARLTTRGETEIVLNRRLLIEARGENFCVVPVDLKKIGRAHATVALDVLLDERQVASMRAHVAPSPRRLATFRSHRGALFDEHGYRVMIVAEREDPDRHWRWVLARYLRDELYARRAKTRRRVLLFGDRMAPLPQPGEPFTDYVERVAARLEAEGRTVQFVPRTPGRLPTVPDVVRFARQLQSLESEGELPDIVVFSPGLSDVAQATGVRNFVRAIDVMVDCLRATDPRIKPVIVSPPPFPGNPRRSRRYAQALHRMAARHNILFLDLHQLLTKGADDWLRAYYATEADGVFRRDPNEAAHERLARALAALLY
ncbi:MAG: GDSL-type esterase/lipase family protein [Candidatus Brocadiia bacterium]